MGMWQAIIARDINSVQHHPDKVRHVAAAYYASKLQVSASWPAEERRAHLEDKHHGLLGRVHHRARAQIVAARNDAVAQLTPPLAAQPAPAPAPTLPALAPPSARAQAPRRETPASTPAPARLPPARLPPAGSSSPPAYATVAARGAARGRGGTSPGRRAAGTRPAVSPGRHVPAPAPQPPRPAPAHPPLASSSPPAPGAEAPAPADGPRIRASSVGPDTPRSRRSYAEVLSASLTSLPPREATSGDSTSPQVTSPASSTSAPISR